MANTVWVDLTVISDDTAKLEEFEKKVRNEGGGKTLLFTFTSLIPIPGGLTDPANLYEWSINNWGTRSDASNSQILARSKESIVYRFETPWSFPEPIIRKVAELFPELQFYGSAFEENDAFECEFSYSPAEGLSIEYLDPEVEEELDEELDEELSSFSPSH